jgi:hypothetical protein
VLNIFAGEYTPNDFPLFPPKAERYSMLTQNEERAVFNRLIESVIFYMPYSDLPVDFGPEDKPVAATQKSTAELVLAAEQVAKPYLISDAGHGLAHWLSGDAVPAQGTAKASKTGTAGKQAGDWLASLSNQRAADKKPFAKRRVPADAEDGADTYEKTAKEWYDGSTDNKAFAQVNDKVSYLLNNQTHFAVAVKLYGDGRVIAARRVNIADDDKITYTDTVDIVNCAEHNLQVIDAFPSVKELVQRAVSSYLGNNNGLIR